MSHYINEMEPFIDANTAVLLKDDKNLNVIPKNSRQLNEKNTSESEASQLKSSSTAIIPCFEIMADNHSWCVTKWQLIDVSNSKVIYTSEPRMKGETWWLALDRLSVVDGTEFYLKAAVEAGSDSSSSVIIKFSVASSDITMFELTGTTFDTTLYYKGLV